MIHGRTITVVIPTKNEAGGVAATVKRIPKEVDRILVVDGMSKDQTTEIARSMGCDVISEPKKGYGQAYLTAFQNIKTELVATCDGDGTYPIELIPHLVQKLDERHLDFLNGSRFPLADTSSMYFKNFWGNSALTFAFNTLFKTTLTDVLSGMWVFQSRIIPDLQMTSTNWNFSEEIKYEVIRRGFRFGEEHVPYRDRLGETKMQPFKTGVENLLFMFEMLFKRGSLQTQIDAFRRKDREIFRSNGIDT